MCGKKIPSCELLPTGHLPSWKLQLLYVNVQSKLYWTAMFTKVILGKSRGGGGGGGGKGWVNDLHHMSELCEWRMCVNTLVSLVAAVYMKFRNCMFLQTGFGKIKLWIKIQMSCVCVSMCACIHVCGLWKLLGLCFAFLMCTFNCSQTAHRYRRIK